MTCSGCARAGAARAGAERRGGERERRRPLPRIPGRAGGRARGGITQVTFIGHQFAEPTAASAFKVGEKEVLRLDLKSLKGKPKKETSKDKKERKQAMQEARQQITTVVLPTLAVVALLIVVFVYVATRPAVAE
ncbi:Single-pass membrane and coiled-coil domain-containing protein 4 [Manis javanica]|nr:Single-pass membrane and coiled-coil domain-containing protein 4 [Manis javanica]